MKLLYICLSKTFLLAGIFLLFANYGLSQTAGRDTVIYYLKYTEDYIPNNATISGSITDRDPFKPAVLVNSVDYADYFIVFLPVKKDSTRDIREYYKTGKIKRTATLMAGGAVGPSYQGLDGICVDYYPNGKKSRIIHFEKGITIGDEYLFYPTGAVYCFKKIIVPNGIYKKILYQDCYDENGNMICQNGNGKWIEYDQDFKRVTIKGQVKNGYWEGEWSGKLTNSDSIKYVYQYKNNKIVKATGYDKDGNAYPFEKEFTYAAFQGGPQNFIQSVRNHFKAPHDNEGKKISIDTMHVSFIIEKNGKPSNIDVLGDVEQNVKDAVATAVSKCMDWTPTKYYGIPYRTKMVLPLIYNHEFSDQYLQGQFVDPHSYGYHTSVYYKMQVLDLHIN